MLDFEHIASHAQIMILLSFQTLLLSFLLLVVHKVSRSTFHGHIYAFYFDKEQLYRFSSCWTFMVVGHLGTFGAPLNGRQIFF